MVLAANERLEQPVQIKGIRDGLLITLSDHPDAAVFDHLQQELHDKQAFLQGGRVAIEVGIRSLDRRTLSRLQTMFEQRGLTLWAVLSLDEGTREVARAMGLATRLSGSQTDLEGNALQPGTPVSSVEEPEPASGDRPAYVPNTLLLRETVRSGRSIFHEGHVVVLGDVNAGAEIVAGGHVMVWGRLRGLVHAGAMGDPTATICALELTPTQLRIADQIAVDPDKSNGRRTVRPEQAVIRDGQIVAEAWQPREGGEKRRG